MSNLKNLRKKREYMGHIYTGLFVETSSLFVETSQNPHKGEEQAASDEQSVPSGICQMLGQWDLAKFRSQWED